MTLWFVNRRICDPFQGNSSISKKDRTKKYYWIKGNFMSSRIFEAR